MAGYPFDLADPPAEPPPEVTVPIMWRVAVRLFRDHEPGDRPPDRCRQCQHPWPCGARRLAVLGLRCAVRATPWEAI